VTNPPHDPNFPDRPDTPDFWRMSETVLYLDGEVQEGGKSVPEIHDGRVDLESLVYTAEQRVNGLLTDLFGLSLFELPNEIRAALGTVYMGAFLHGVLFQKAGGHRD
jgi:hypothetical protein